MDESRQKLIVITGVTRGLGRALVEGFADAGHRVVGCATDTLKIARLSEEIAGRNDFRAVDKSSDSQVASWAADVIGHYGPPDLLINNAALINRPDVLWKVPAGQFDRLIDVNIKGVANMVRHFVPVMVEQGRGVIVNFSSGWGRSASPEVAPYCASKFAVEGLTQALAKELPRGMAAVALNPGIIDTDMLRSAWGDGASQHESPDQWKLRAVPFILGLSAADNGGSLSIH